MSSNRENTRACCKCGSSSAEDPSITLHRFPHPGPRNILRCELWAKYCFPNEAWSSPNFQKELHNKHKMLCSKHFRTSCFINNKLFKTAVPDVGNEDSTVPILSVSETNDMFVPIAGTSEIVTPFLGLNMDIPNATHVTAKDKLEVSQGPSKQKDEDGKMKKLLLKMKSKMNKIYRLEKNIKHLKNESFLNVLSKNETVTDILQTKVTPTFALLLQGELQNFKKKSRGRRWNTEEKIIALRLYKKSPTCYKLLRRMICLPTPSTLKSLLNKFRMHTGPNDKILHILKKYARSLPPSEREFTLLWDEMSIRKHLWYNPKEDVIEGFQNHATQGRSSQVASYALVFMVVGIRKKVKQPVAYYLSGGSVTADRLSVLIKEVLNSCFDADLNICVSVCDMDGVNKRALCLLGASAELPVIKVGQHKIVTIFDTPHLLKCFRNLFLKYDIKFTCDITSDNREGIGIAKWSHIKLFYQLDNSNPNFVFAPCLREEHLNPNSKQKMKVKLAAQVLSHSVAAGMYSKIANGVMPNEAIATANLIAKMDTLFDSVNACTSDLRRGKKYSTNMKENTGHITFFREMKNFFRNCVFLECRITPPSKEGWVWTLNGLELVWCYLTKKHKTIKSLSTRRIQQDPLENLFGCIRANCGSNSNPTASQFVAGLKTAVLSNLGNTGSGNCEIDENEAILDNFKKLLSPASDISVTTENTSITTLLQDQNVNSSLEENMEEANGEMQACAYVCGFIIKNCKNNCNACKKIFVSNTQEAVHNFIEFKTYETVKNSLIYTTRDVIEFVEKSATIINNFLVTEAFTEDIKIKITEILRNSINYNFLHNCFMHLNENREYLINSVFYICIKRYSILKNRSFAKEAAASTLKRKMNIILHR